MHFMLNLFALLRRGDFRYTKLFFLTISYVIVFRASGEAILGTLKNNSEGVLDFFSCLRRIHFRYTNKVFVQWLFSIMFFAPPARRFQVHNDTLSKHFIQALYPSTLSKHFIKALYQSTLSKHFIKVFLKHFRNTYQTSLYNLSIGVRYYEV